MGRTDTNRQWTTYRILDATIDNPDLADPLNLGATGANEGKGFILWGDTSAAKIEWDEASDRLLTTGATIRFGTTDKLEFRDTSQYIQSSTGNQLDLAAGVAIELHQDTILTAGKSLGLSGNGYFAGWYLQMTNFKAKDGTASFSIADSTGIITVATDVKLQFRSASHYIQSDAADDLMVNAGTNLMLGIGGTDEVTLTTTALTLATNNLTLTAGNLTVGGTSGFTGLATFSGDAMMFDKDKLYFRDTGLYIQSDVDSKIRIVSDGTSYDDVTFQCTAFHLDSVRMSSSARVQFRGAGNYIHSSTTDNLDLVSAGPIRLTTGAGQGIYLLGGHVYIGHMTADGISDGQIWYHAASDQFRCRADGSTLAFVTSTFGSNVTLAGTSKLYFRDTGLSISSDVDSKLRIISDGTSYDDVTFQCTAFHLDNIRMSGSAKLELRGTGNYIHASATDRVTIVSSGTTSSAIEMGVGAGGGIHLGGIVLIGHSTVDGVSDGQIWYDPVADEFKGRKAGATVNISTS